MNIHLMPRSIYLSRVSTLSDLLLLYSNLLIYFGVLRYFYFLLFLFKHGESEYNKMGRLGGDSPLSDRGLRVSLLYMFRLRIFLA